MKRVEASAPNPKAAPGFLIYVILKKPLMTGQILVLKRHMEIPVEGKKGQMKLYAFGMKKMRGA